MAVRAYSFCSLPVELPQFELCVRQVRSGIGTTFLNENIGKTVEFSGTQGDFILPSNIKGDLVFLAAGVGIAPVRSQLRYLYENRPEFGSTLIYQCRQDEYLFGGELKKMARSWRKFNLFIKPGGRKNFNIKKRDLPDTIQMIYVVGPPGFVNLSLEILHGFGYDNQVIKFDIW